MNFHQINPDRKKWVLTIGLGQKRVFDFLRNNKQKLIASGVKIQNIPKDYKKSISILVKLTGKAEALFLQWLKDQFQEPPEMSAEDLADQVLLNEQGNNESSAEEIVNLARGILYYALKDDTPDFLCQILSNPIPTVSPSKTSLVGPDTALFPSEQGPEVQKGEMEYPTEKAEKTLGTHLRQAFEDPVALLSGDANPDFATVLVAVQVAIRRGQMKTIQALLPRMEKEAAKLGIDLNACFPHDASSSPTSGVLRVQPLPNDRNIDIEAVEVLGRCKPNSTSGDYCFIEALGVKDQEALFSLNNSQRLELFPHRGDVIYKQLSPASPLPQANQWGLYKVEMVEGEHRSNKVKVIHSRPVYHLIVCPFSSGEHDQLRNWLLENDQCLPDLHILFQLKDGWILGVPKGLPINLEQYSVFQKPFPIWENIPFVEWEKGNLFVIHELPPVQRVLNLSPVDHVIKRMIRIAAQHAKRSPEIDALASRQTLNDIAKIIENVEDNEGLLERMADVNAAVDGLTHNKEVLKEIVARLFEQPTINSAIEVEKRRILQEYEEQLVREKADLATLTLEKDKINRELLDLKKTIKQSGVRLKEEILRQFNQAQQEGMATLSQVALLQPFLHKEGSEVPPPAMVEPSLQQQPTLSNACHARWILSPPLREPVQTLQEIGFHKPKAKNLARLLPPLWEAGFTLGIRGTIAPWAAERLLLSFISTKAGIIDLEAGLTSPAPLIKAMQQCADCDGILINHINASDPVLCLGPVLSDMATALSTPGKGVRLKHILTLLDSPSSLSLPPVLKYLIPTLDLDAISKDEEIQNGFSKNLEDLEDFQEWIDKQGVGRVYSRLWFQGITYIYKHLETSMVSESKDNWNAILQCLASLFLPGKFLE